MSVLGRNLQIGDDALTDFNGKELTKVKIIDKDCSRKHGHSQSGTMFRVSPPLKHGSISTWYDADWFMPTPKD